MFGIVNRVLKSRFQVSILLNTFLYKIGEICWINGYKVIYFILYKYT